MSKAKDIPGFLQIDLSSEEGRVLVRSVATRYGDGLARAASFADRMFVLHSPFAPGLRFVGAQARDRQGELVNLSGTGESLEEAFVSCIAEGIERLALAERPGDVAMVAGLEVVKDRVMQSALPVIEHDLAEAGHTAATEIDWMRAASVNPGTDFAGPEVLVPADWCLRRRKARSLGRHGAVSTGVASGPDHEWAASRALLELVERDAASLWWEGGRRARPVAIEAPGLQAAARLIGGLRQGARDRHTWLLDLTTDVGIPVAAALSCAADGLGFACGLASRLTFETAARSAVLELCQMELAHALSEAKRTAGGSGLTPLDLLHLEQSRKIDANRCELLHPMGSPLSHQAPPGASALASVARALAQADIEASLVDLSRQGEATPVVRAIAPTLQPLSSGIVTPRLTETIAKTGGGSRFSGGVRLM
jgi:ribosomal protein S12 methylthiotransferase accessory factor